MTFLRGHGNAVSLPKKIDRTGQDCKNRKISGITSAFIYVHLPTSAVDISLKY
ncbi:hypothetical protein QUB68_13130 [Microcoleus sp. A006_D1]|uniref:hypothetical protein n=1 Tax=Microcoleus sp. A006_D1 TaxID=3055267 RepID=UPI002FD1C64E